jgi:hypothetical protein
VEEAILEVAQRVSTSGRGAWGFGSTTVEGYQEIRIHAAVRESIGSEFGAHCPSSAFSEAL